MSFESLVDDFSFMDDWEDRYKYVIDLGRTLAPLAAEERVDDNKVRGCASQVWLVNEKSEDGQKLRFRGDSDAHIVRGLIAILIALYNEKTPNEILKVDPKAQLQRLDLDSQLSPQRSNGLHSMIERIRSDAADAL